MEAILSAILFAILLGFLLLALRFLRLPGLPGYVSVSIFLLKCFLGIGWLYGLPEVNKQNRLSNMDALFKESEVLFELAFSNNADFLRLAGGLNSESPYYDRLTVAMPHWDSRKNEADDLFFLSSRSMIRIHACLRFLSGNSSPAQVVIFNFFVIACLIFSFKTFIPYFTGREKWFLTALFLVPSVFVWSAGLFNFSLSFGLLSIALSVAIRTVIQPLSFSKGLVYLFVLLLTSLALPVLSFVLIMSLILVLALQAGKWISGTSAGMALFIIILVLVYLMDQLLFNQMFTNQLIAAQQESLNKLASGGLAIGVENQALKPVWWSFLRNMPEALFNGAFRPGLLDALSSFQWLSALESASMVILIALAVGLFTPSSGKQEFLLRNFLFSASVWFLIAVGLTSNVWSDISARRAIFLPYATMALLLVIDTNRLKAIIFEVLNIHGNNTDNGSNIGNR